MADAVSAAKSKADKARVPLVVAVAETHDEVRTLTQNSGVLHGNAIILSVPRTASQDLRYLNEVSRSETVPRVHVFPPSANTRLAPQYIQQQIEQYTPFWARLASSMDPGTAGAPVADNQREITSVVQSFDLAATAWNQAQQQQRSNNNNNSNNNGSPTRQDASPSDSSINQPAPIPRNLPPPSNKPSSSTDIPPKAADDGNPSATVRIVPKVHIRLHASAPSSTKFPFVNPQPRTTGLPLVRKIIARAAENSFGENFLFVQGNSNVMVRIADEGPLIAQDVCHGSDLYICPIAPPAAPTPAAAVANKPSQDAAASSAKPATTSSASSGKLRIKITFPDGSSEVTSDFTTSSTAQDLADFIRTRLGDERQFYIQLPQARIRDDQMSSTLAQLNVRGSVALRVYDVEAMRQRAQEFDQQGSEQQQGGAPPTGDQQQQSMLSSLMSRFGGRQGSNTSEDAAPPPASRGAPRSMAELRQQQEEEEKRKKQQQGGRPGANEFYGGSGTNTQAPPPDDDRPL